MYLLWLVCMIIEYPVVLVETEVSCTMTNTEAPSMLFPLVFNINSPATVTLDLSACPPGSLILTEN